MKVTYMCLYEFSLYKYFYALFTSECLHFDVTSVSIRDVLAYKKLI